MAQKIEWKINIGNPSDYQKGTLPFVIPAIFIIFISMFLKTKHAGHRVVFPITIILFCIAPATNIEINGFLFGLSFLGLTSPYADNYNVFQALRQTKEGDYLQFYGDDLYACSDNL